MAARPPQRHLTFPDKRKPRPMTTPGQFSTAAMVQFERRLPGPLTRTWRYISEASLLPEWFGDGAIEPFEGGKFSLGGGHVRGVVTQWRPPLKLAYSWNVFEPGETTSPYPESYLTIELEPAGDQVQLTLTHLPVLPRFEAQNAMGWHTYLDMTEAAVRGEPVAPRSTYMERNAKLYGVDLAHPTR